MKDNSIKISENTKNLAGSGYWPARAAVFLAEGLYSKAVEICLENIPQYNDLVSGHLIYAQALYLAGQIESATEQFYEVLVHDPDNIVALKYLGDIKFTGGEEIAAMANYNRIFEIDPNCRGLRCHLSLKARETTHSITITRGEEFSPVVKEKHLRSIPFYTETMADLYLSQGHARLAAEVYDYLNKNDDNPRLRDKLFQAQDKIKEKE